MQAIQLIVNAAALTAGAVWLAIRLAHRARSGERWAGLMLGLVAGLLGVSLVAVLSADTIPDEWEVGIRAIAIVGISAIAIVGSVYRFTHR